MATKTIQSDGHDIKVSHPEKVMYPDDGFTKADVIDFYGRVAQYMVPHLTNRPLTMKRFPRGVGGDWFFEKNAPSGTPAWVRTAPVASPGSTKNRDFVEYVVADEAATLLWLAQLSTLELHVPQWRLDSDRRPDRLVFDLDPGEGAGFADCAAVALLLRERLSDDGLTPLVKSSGKKGLHVCCGISGTQIDADASDYAKALARQLETEKPDQVVSRMAKDLRHGKVFIDWSQNNAAKTTVAVYSLRNQPYPTVSTPMTWEEIESGVGGEFTPQQVLDRLARDGDLFAELLRPGPRIPG